MKKCSSALAFGAVLLAPFFLLILMGRVWFPRETWAADASSVPATLGEPLAARLLIVVADSVRREAMEDPVYSPFFHETGGRGIRGIMTVPGPSLTGISVLSLGTGTTPPLAAAMTNFVVPPWDDESLFSLLSETGTTFGFFGDDTWAQAFGVGASFRHVYPFSDFYGEFENDWYPEDLRIIPALEDVITNQSWKCLVVHFSTTDKLAHRYGATLVEPRSNLPTPYVRAIHNIDRLTQRLFRLAGSDTTVFLLSDHGCTVSGTHGSFDLETREVRFAAAGPGIPVIPEDVRLEAIEFAPLAARVLGLRPPRCAEAPVRTELLELSPEEALATQRSAFNVRSEFIRRRISESGNTGALAALDEEPALKGNSEYDENALRVQFSKISSGLVELMNAERAKSRWIGFSLGLCFLVAVLIALNTPGDEVRNRSISALRFPAALLLCVFVFVWRLAPYYRVMGSSAAWLDYHPLVYGLVSVLFGFLAAWTIHRFAPGHRAFVSLVLFLFAGLMPVLWPYGPVLPAAGLICVCLLGLVSRQDRQYRVHPLLLTGVTAPIALVYFSSIFLDFGVVSLFRAASSVLIKVSSSGIFLAMGGLLVMWLLRRPEFKAGRILLPVVFGLATFVCAELAMKSGQTTWSHLSLVHATIALVLTWFLFEGVIPRAAIGGWVHLGLYRLLTQDVNFAAGLLLALSLTILVVLLRHLKEPDPRVSAALFLGIEFTYFFAQGYHYALSAFDMNTAFVLVRGALDLKSAALAITLQQYIPGFLSAAAFFCVHAGDERLSRRRLFTLFLIIQMARVITTNLVLPFYQDDGWVFLRAVHAQAFETMRYYFYVAAVVFLAGSKFKWRSRERSETSILHV